jgi:hypothetical protein
VTYDVEGPEPVAPRSYARPLRTGIILLLLIVAVLIAGRWGWDQLTQPFGDVTAATSPTPTADAAATPTCTPAPKKQRLPAPSAITVNVYNAGQIQGLAGDAAAELQAQGFTIGAVDNDPLGKRLEGVGEIRSAPSSEDQVKSLLRYVPGATWVQDGRADSTLDFAAGAGFDEVTVPPKPSEADEDDGIPTC